MFKVIILILTGLSAGCPDGWLTHGGMCYLFSHGREDWPGSYEMCKIMGGQLVEIESAAENNYIELQAKPSNYWIGLSDDSEEGSWVWMSSQTPLAATYYTNWFRNEPSRFIDGEPENCVEMYTHLGGEWNDAPCTNFKNYICEKALGSSVIIG
ncbi:CD209 antigen-like isoform X2 [Ruditapes philippinarum]|uniref:CD209 antigen-like isoform X2 n=1 Tax=Ruditapes philippinarum TaxID=129788 RepID=UPI00295BAE29|nr:CD209 antigen-like isoform X2 [Ruditapes philippinarum]